MSRQLDEKVLVSGQIRPEDVAALVGEGVTMLVNNRPDGEEPDQPLGMDIEKGARAAGIEYSAIPMQDAIKAAKGKVFAFCRTGTRSSLAWALAKSDEGMSREDIERHLSDVGVDPTPIAHLL